ncbi:MAG: cytochrome c [Gammaproteobacteria bacterium]|nr:cytochrome c [Gammaproteobacteria bacterium]
MINYKRGVLVVIASVIAQSYVTTAALSAGHEPSMVGHEPPTAEAPDTRVVADFPEPIKQAMLQRMRRNLTDIQRIQAALGEGNFDQAAEVAEFSLGVSSLGPHNARQAPYMPSAMKELGMTMHKASSQLALVAQTGDMQESVRELAKVTGYCVACHASYRAK